MKSYEFRTSNYAGEVAALKLNGQEMTKREIKQQLAYYYGEPVIYMRLIKACAEPILLDTFEFAEDIFKEDTDRLNICEICYDADLNDVYQLNLQPEFVKIDSSEDEEEIVYSDATICRMGEQEIEDLGLMYPKAVFFQMETSGSPSAWTDNGEYLAGHKGSDIVRCAKEIREKAEDCKNNSDWNFWANIRVIF